MMNCSITFDGGETSNERGLCGNISCLQKKNLDQTEYLKTVVEQIIPTSLGLILLVGIVGNLLIVAVVLTDIKMRTSTNITIVSLALADVFFLSFCVIPTILQFTTGTWLLGETTCRVASYLNFVFATASVCSLVLMSLDRYLALVYPFRTLTFRTQKNVTMTIVITWVTLFVVNIPVYVGMTLIPNPYATDGSLMCYYPLDSVEPAKLRIWVAFFFIVIYILPLGIITIVYALILRTVMQSSRVGNHSTEGNKARQLQITKMVVVVLTTFALCWLPMHIFLIAFAHGSVPMNYIGKTMEGTIKVWCYVNSCINVFVYGIFSKNFREGYRRILCGWKKAVHKKNHTSMVSSRRITKQTNIPARDMEAIPGLVRSDE